jgi:hypothetical protein
MRSLQEYLTESKKDYEYRIKVAGEITKEQIDKIKSDFAQFDMIQMAEQSSTPVVKSPYDFPNLENVRVNIFDVKFNYPAGEQQIKQITELAGINIDHVVVLGTAFDESMKAELETQASNSDGALLEKDLPESTKDAKDASKAYGESFLGMVKDLETRKYEIEKGGE